MYGLFIGDELWDWDLVGQLFLSFEEADDYLHECLYYDIEGSWDVEVRLVV